MPRRTRPSSVDSRHCLTAITTRWPRFYAIWVLSRLISFRCCAACEYRGGLGANAGCDELPTEQTRLGNDFLPPLCVYLAHPLHVWGATSRRKGRGDVLEGS